ncbi:DUF4352 domain-containing protein [Actinotalea sp. AC32]|nr:DUF4352 domain-containing protein [Actinotalea sp. AC32]
MSHTPPPPPHQPYPHGTPTQPPPGGQHGYGAGAPYPYGADQPGPAGPAGQAPTPRKSWFARHKILTTLGVVVLLVIVGASLGGGDDDAPGTGGTNAVGAGAGAADSGSDTPADEPDVEEPAVEEPAAEEPAEEPAATLPGIGTPVRDGKFEFTVTQVETGVTRVGSDMLGEEAQGQFVLVHLTVTNIGDEAQYFDGSSQDLQDTQGRTHSADTAAAIYLDGESFLNQINPGNTVEGVVVFDVPADAQLATITLHDSMFSGGVEVALG